MAPTEAGPNYHADVRPIIESACVPCHAPGQIAELLDLRHDPAQEAGTSPRWSVAAASAVAADTMPPWPPDETCHPIAGSLALTAADRHTVADWAAHDFPAGRPEEFRPRPAVIDPMTQRGITFGEPDQVLAAPQPYVPSTARPDDYHCFLLDSDFEIDTWVRGIEVVPDRRELVHHLILYMYFPEEQARIAEVIAADTADPGPGFPCYGSPPAQTVAAWAPGQKGEFLRPGLARKVPAGALWFLQMHYNTLGRRPEEIIGDQTAIRVWTQPDPPEKALVTVDFANLDIMLPAGDPDIVHTRTLDLGQRLGIRGSGLELPVIGIMAHMHQLGEEITAGILRADGASDCLVRIPRWQFDWQQAWFFPEDRPVVLDESSVASMTCRYDNSAENQIVVDGVQLEPRDVYWGEGTTDEMCMTFLLTELPAALLESSAP